jgi:nucleolar protein 4
MSPRKKRQKLSEDAQKSTSLADEENELSHSKAKQRSLFVRSLAPNTTDEDLTAHFSQSYPIKHAVTVIDKVTKHCKGYGFVTFADGEDAWRAIEEFNGSILHGKQIQVELAEPRHRSDDIPLPNQTKSRNTNTREAPPTPKLIVRNLPWSINTPDKLTHLFLSYGKIKHAVVPKNNAGRMLGFGVVVIRGRKNAEKALQGMNGKEIDGRTIAVDWAVDKETWQQVRGDVVREEQADRESIDQADEQALQDMAHDDGHIDGHSDARESKLSEDELDQDDVEPETIDLNNDGDVSMERNESKSTSSSTNRTSNDSTIFVRNLPFTCGDEDLADHFSQFGSIRYARVVYDQSTERSRGTGFVCFRNKADAHSCLREAPKANTGAKEKSSQATSQSILQDESSDPSGRYTIDGRILHVTKAVEKAEADRLTREGVAHRNHRDRDKRRLYLLTEGTIPSKSQLYKNLSQNEIAMREASVKQRKALVESNPSLHLSLTRLAVRNIPRSISSKDLKALARDAVVGFAKDVKSGIRQPLSKEEMSRGREEMQRAEKERKLKGKGVVKQAKVVFEARKGEKIPESSGAGRSRGYGFIEYHTHRSALMGLRWLNGHAIGYEATENLKAGKVDKGERKKRLIVEFALENANVVNRRKEKELKVGKKHKVGEDVEHSRQKADGQNLSKRDDAAYPDNSSAKHEGSTQNIQQQKIIAKKRALRRAKKKQLP